jgi:hypothetical protein
VGEAVSNPFAPNADFQSVADEADNYGIGLTEPNDGSPPKLVIAFDRGRRSIAVFLDKPDAEELLGRMTEQMREMGWLS